MTIYVEYVIVDNMVVNTLILLLTKFFLKENSKKLNIFFGSLIGTIFSLLSPLFSNIINILLKIPLSMLMCLTAFQPKSAKKFFPQIIVFYISTFLFVGACLIFAETLKIEYIVSNGISYQYSFPMGFVLLVVIFIYFVLKNGVAQIFSAHKNDKFIYSVKLISNNNQILTQAFLDTGNTLELDGKAISIINFKTFSKLYPDVELLDLILKKQLPLKNSKYFKIKGLGSEKEILIFEIDVLEIINKSIKNALVGVSFEKFGDKLKSDMIISNKILEEAK